MIAAIGFGAWHQQSRVVDAFVPLASQTTTDSTARDASDVTTRRKGVAASVASDVLSTFASHSANTDDKDVYAFVASNPRSKN